MMTINLRKCRKIEWAIPKQCHQLRHQSMRVNFEKAKMIRKRLVIIVLMQARFKNQHIAHAKVRENGLDCELESR